MTDIKHTPGPWHWENPRNMGGDNLRASALGSEEHLAVLRIETYEGAWPGTQDDGQDKANMLLIAVAPELFDVAQGLVDLGIDERSLSESWPELAKVLADAQLAIAKARGEQ